MTTTPRRLIAQALELPVSAVRVEPRARLAHQRNNLYDAWAGERHMVVKEYFKRDEEAPVREAGAMRLLAPLDIAPQLVLCHATVESDFGPFVVYNWMEGEMWDRRRPTPQELGRLANLWLVLHEFPTEDLWMSPGYGHSLQASGEQFMSRFQQYAAWVRAEYPAALPVIELGLHLLERAYEAATELEHLRPVFRFCRADARFANVIERPSGRLGLVDWEDCGLRDPARDIADLLTGANQEDLLTWTDWQAFLQPYLAGRATTDAELERRMELYLEVFPILRLTILVSYGLQRVQTGQLASWEINDMAPNLRLRRYLARALAWPKHDFAGEFDALAGLTFFPEERPSC